MNLIKFTKILIQLIDNNYDVDLNFNYHKHHFSDHLFIYLVIFDFQKLVILFKIQAEAQQYEDLFCMFHIKFSQHLLNVVILIDFNEIINLMCYVNLKNF